MFSAEARSVAPMGPSMRTTPTTFPNGPQRKPVEFRKNRKYKRPSSTGAPKNMAWNRLRQRRSAFRSLAASSAERSKDWRCSRISRSTSSTTEGNVVGSPFRAVGTVGSVGVGVDIALSLPDGQCRGQEDRTTSPRLPLERRVLVPPESRR